MSIRRERICREPLHCSCGCARFAEVIGRRRQRSESLRRIEGRTVNSIQKRVQRSHCACAVKRDLSNGIENVKYSVTCEGT